MINRKRKLLPVLAAVSLMLAGLSGCGGHAEPPLEAAAYSNLTDAVSRGLLSESLADSGISENRVSILLDRVDQFNASVKNEWLTEGFESGALTDTKYDPYEMQELWTEKNGSFPGYNCRITAYELMGDRITAGEDQPDTNGEDWLFMDLETLKRDPDALCGKSTADFCALFAPVEALPMASSVLRTRLAAGEECENELPASVRRVIRREGLYTKGDEVTNESETGKRACAQPAE